MGSGLELEARVHSLATETHLGYQDSFGILTTWQHRWLLHWATL